MSEEDQYLAGLREFAASTGQVECGDSVKHFSIGLGRTCPDCGAAR